MKVFYISPKGNDCWSGEKPDTNLEQTDGPFATLERARRATKYLRQISPQLNEPIHIKLRGGTYQLHQTFVLEKDDSGTEKSPTIYEAYQDESPIITGSIAVNNWQHQGNNQWTTQVSDMLHDGWKIRQLFANDHRCERSVLPQKGFYEIAEEVEPVNQSNSWDRFVYHKNDLQAWEDVADAEVISLTSWRTDRLAIKQIDAEKKQVIFNGKTDPAIAHCSKLVKGTRYQIQNILAGLLKPGQWHMNHTTGVLTYLAEKKQDPNEMQFRIPKLATLVRLKGEIESKADTEIRNAYTDNPSYVSHVHFSGLTFAETAWNMPKNGLHFAQAELDKNGRPEFDLHAAIEAQKAHHCHIQNCTITRTGNHAISFARACKSCSISDNHLYDIGANGIKIGEAIVRSGDNQITHHNQIDNNHIHHGGRIHYGAVGIWIGQTYDNSVKHNHVHHFYYTGISVGFTWGYGPSNTRHITIEHNHIHHIGQGMLSDMGGIYLLGIQHGTVIRHNHIHDISCDEHGYGGLGIYTDEGCSYVLIENNFVHNTSSSSFFQHYGRENIIRNNIFAFSKEMQVHSSQHEPHRSFTFERNIMIYDQGTLFGTKDHKLWYEEAVLCHHNLYWHLKNEPITANGQTLEQRQAKGYDLDSIIADPHFRNPYEGDFTFVDDHAIKRIGFTPFTWPNKDTNNKMITKNEPAKLSSIK